jgi:hypothetical protein
MLAAVASGVEYHPTGTELGPPDPVGQNTDELPHWNAVSFRDPAGQKWPALHGPVHDELGSAGAKPNRPATSHAHKHPSYYTAQGA